MKKVRLALGGGEAVLRLPAGTDVFSMAAPDALASPADAIVRALAAPIGSPPLRAIAATRKASAWSGEARAVIVISDNTRPVPYRGESGILRPVIESLVAEGYEARNVTVVVATGTHRPMREEELRAMLDPWVFEQGVAVVNHDCKDDANLVRLGTTARGSEVFIDRRYVEADLKILTGLVESHFMAGASGGRKSVCPGLVGEKSTYVFHGAPMMAHEKSRDLVLDGNPCHEEALEVAKMAGVDFIVNVTLDHSFRTTGVFAGDLEEAHAAAVAKVKSYVSVGVDGEYDIVVTHAGYVGINHYQAAKAAVAATGALKTGGHLVLIADNTDGANPVGSLAYRTCLQLLTVVGAEAFDRLLLSDAWTFIPEQWQVQKWAEVFKRIPMGNFIYFAPQLDERHWSGLPGIDGAAFVEPERRGRLSLSDAADVVERALSSIIARSGVEGRPEPRIAYLADGPYGIPFNRGAPCPS
ncbi:MAG: nickel-dependent lactate racemase [Rectinemataceae bacterium]|jgi:nickel-dependent lactate racemase